MKSLKLLHAALLDEAGKRMRVNTHLDRDYLLSRSSLEGDQFLQITLPKFGKAILRSIEDGQIDMELFAGFKPRGRHQQLPAFLQGFVSILFSDVNGYFIDWNPATDSTSQQDQWFAEQKRARQADALRSILQITLFSQKEFRVCSESRVHAAYAEFVKTDEIIREVSSTILSDEVLVKHYVTAGRRAFSGLFNYLDKRIREFDLTGRVSGGSVADNIRPNQRWNFSDWPEDLDSVFPYINHGSPTPSHWAYSELPLIPRDGVSPARVTAVPKTQLTPRIIAIEPAVKQFAQQALLAAFRDYTDHDSLLGPVLSVADQTPNQRMARSGSRDRLLSTIDLSEASDRVPFDVLMELVRPWNNLYDFMVASRSSEAEVPGFGVISLSKYASMGSALCFPFEMVHFVCSILAGQLSAPIDEGSDVPYLKISDIRVYGDDIIVPSDSFSRTVHALELYGAKVNKAKSYFRSPFRESCGKEYLYGHDVSIVKYRFRLGTSTKQAESLIPTVELHNLLYEFGWHDTADLLRSWFPDSGHRLGFKSIGGVGVAFVTYDEVPAERHMKAPLQRAELFRFVDGSKSPIDKLDGYGAMLKVFSAHRMYDDVEHLMRAGRPATSVLHRRWVPRDPLT